MRNKLLIIGPVTKDTIINQDDEYIKIGGAVYYQLITLYQLKIPLTSIITIGKNDLEMLEEIPKTEIKIIKTKQTTNYVNIYDENQKRKQKAILPKNPITPLKIKETKINIKEYKTAILSPLSPTDIPLETLKFLKENKIEIILVAQGYIRYTDENNNIYNKSWKNYEKFLKYTDTLCLDKNEFKTALNIKNINTTKILKIQHNYNINEIIITKAENGSSIYKNNTKIDIPAIKTQKIVDPTGLGDTYIAAYIAKKQETDDVLITGYYASITAKYKLETKEQISFTDKLINQNLKKYLKRNKLK